MDGPVTPDMTEVSNEQRLHSELEVARNQLRLIVEQLNDERILASVYQEKLKEVEKENLDLRVMGTKLNIELQQLRQLTMGTQSPIPAPEPEPQGRRKVTKARLKSSTTQPKG